MRKTSKISNMESNLSYSGVRTVDFEMPHTDYNYMYHEDSTDEGLLVYDMVEHDHKGFIHNLIHKVIHH